MKKRTAIISAAVAIAAIAGYLTWENEAIGVTEYAFSHGDIPAAFDGFKICQLSDIHVRSAGRKYSSLIKKTAAQQPDIIVITGDLIDSRRSDISSAVTLVETLAEISPVYCVTGNHEERLPIELYNELLSSLSGAGVHVLDGKTEKIFRDGCFIAISGMSDSAYFNVESGKKLFSEGVFDIFLNHRPQFARGYALAGADLTFSGHAHGGQMRIPFIGGLIAPDQMFFPKFSEGIHRFGSAATVISRGVGNSLIPFRVNNRPEIVTVRLEMG